jgi:hypothetical protein
MMADQHTKELSPQQEYSRQPQPTNQTKPKACATKGHLNTTDGNSQQKITGGNYNRRKDHITVSSRILIITTSTPEDGHVGQNM